MQRRCSLFLLGTVLIGVVGCSRSDDDGSVGHSPSQAATRNSDSTGEEPKTSFGKALHSAEKLRGEAADRNDELAEQAGALDDEGDDPKDDVANLE